MIIGAGFAGLIAGHIFPAMPIIDAMPEPQQMHHALLRFRSDAVSRVTGIEFRKVRVRKGIYDDGGFHQPDIRLANLYSQKCLGKILNDRSIWNIDPADRFIAPESLYEQLVESLKHRINWATPFVPGCTTAPVISTMPLPLMLEAMQWAVLDQPFDREAITVQRFRVPSCDAFQTVYFPTMSHSMYRASITGDLLLVEFIGEPEGDWERDLDEAMALAGEFIALGAVKQSYGKIAPIDETVRKRLIHDLSADRNVFSLGRFATWRNILLDDVVDDAAVVKRLLNATQYDRRIAAL